MEVIIGQSVTIDFTTHNPTTGNVSDADSLPECDIFAGSNDSPLVSPTVSKRAGLTGHYRASFAATNANGFQSGVSYNVVITAIVAAVTAKSVICSFILGTTLSPPPPGFSL